jgi:hypothetical protein
MEGHPNNPKGFFPLSLLSERLHYCLTRNISLSLSLNHTGHNPNNPKGFFPLSLLSERLHYCLPSISSPVPQLEVFMSLPSARLFRNSKCLCRFRRLNPNDIVCSPVSLSLSSVGFCSTRSIHMSLKIMQQVETKNETKNFVYVVYVKSNSKNFCFLTFFNQTNGLVGREEIDKKLCFSQPIRKQKLCKIEF